MRIFIIGNARCGKSTAACYLAGALGCEVAETGDVVIEHLANLYCASNGSADGAQTWSKLIRVGKPEFRKELAAVGDMLVGAKPTYLIDECAKRARIIVGVRRRREVLGYFQNCSRDDWNCIWIRVVAGYRAPADGCYELQSQPCDYEVINSGDLNELQRKMAALGRVIQTKSAA